MNAPTEEHTMVLPGSGAPVGAPKLSPLQAVLRSVGIDGVGREPTLPRVGERLFGFHLRAELGRGAFARVFLAEQATEMLGNARFWFSQLTLVQALCLWEMPESGAQTRGEAGTRHASENRPKNSAPRHGSNPGAIVERWLESVLQVPQEQAV